VADVPIVTGLTAFFAPKSVAVVGASATRGKAGYFLFRNILGGGYRGRVYAVNPGSKRVLGYRSYPSIAAIEDEIDLAFLIVSNAQVQPVLSDCVRQKVKAAMIVTAGFAETGDEGRRAQDEIAGVVRNAGMRAIGPNSVGLVSAPARLMGSFVPFPRWPQGRIAIAAQTGIFTGAYMDQLAASTTQKVGFSRSVCLGNCVDVDEADFLEYALHDPETDVVAVHLESFRRPRVFLEAARDHTPRKPVVVLKSGRSEAGARVAASHSGAVASEDRVVSAALKQYGIVRAQTIDDFVGISKAFAWQPLPKRNRVGVITLSGALGVMAVDAMQGTGLRLAHFAETTTRTIAALMPPWQPVRNPADVWMALGSGPAEAHERILRVTLADPGVDMLLCILLPIPNADFREVRQVFARLRQVHPDKPIFLVLIGGEVKNRWLRDLEPLRLPVYAGPEAAVRAMEAMRFFAEHRARDGAQTVLKPEKHHERLPAHS
jgi:acetyltransferase